MFAVPIRGEAVVVDRARIQVVDTGGRSLIIDALSEPRAGERWTLRVPLADGKAPELAEFALVSRPSEVDMELEVARSEQPEPASHAVAAAPERQASGAGTGCAETRSPCGEPGNFGTLLSAPRRRSTRPVEGCQAPCHTSETA